MKKVTSYRLGFADAQLVLCETCSSAYRTEFGSDCLAVRSFEYDGHCEMCDHLTPTDSAARVAAEKEFSESWRLYGRVLAKFHLTTNQPTNNAGEIPPALKKEESK